MSDRINIGREIKKLCDKLGLEPTNVASITFEPSSVTAVVYKVNDRGAKYLEESPETLPGYDPESSDATGFSTRPATETLTFEVRT